MSIPEAAVQLDHYRSDASVRERSMSSCLVRLFRALDAWESGSGSAWDIASHLRQFILTYRRKVYIREELRDLLQPICSYFALNIEQDLEVDVLDDLPSWFPGMETLQQIYRLEERRMLTPTIGDGILYSMTEKFTTYQSDHQKAIVQAAMSMAPGDTLLACLPTGGGKSLIALLPAFFETQGGTLRSGVLKSAGVTIVVVPTTALALDQRNAARKFFTKGYDEKCSPQAYRGDMPKEEKELILEGLREGSIPLLFTSPESLVIGPLGDVVLDLARRGGVNRFVIDEAHMVIDWGNHFRTSFQLLSTFRKKLLAESQGKLKTVLMSATLTEWTTNILRQMFSEEGKYTELRCDALRFEPCYVVDHSKSDEERYLKITAALGFLPRPVILYVNTRDHAKEWMERIRTRGYHAVKVFTGETPDDERKLLLDEWNLDRIDIMVATSAFGMGVDKPDIRTIIHCCLPESMNRYYQEVGRGGRDGYASLSVLSYVKDDLKIARSNTSKEIITPEMLVNRWEAMYEFSKSAGSNERWFDMSVQPEHLRHTVSGEPNANWNVASLLLMARHGLVEIQDFEKVPDETPYVPHIKIKINETGVINNPKALLDRISPERELERERISKELNTIVEYVSSPEKACISYYLLQTYPYSEYLCGGCPHCRKTGKTLTYNQTKLHIPYRSGNTLQSERVESFLKPYFLYRELIVQWLNHERKDALSPLVNTLIREKVRHIVFPNWPLSELEAVIRLAPNERQKVFYTLMQMRELNSRFAEFITGPIALIYPNEVSKANSLYVWSRSYLNKHPDNLVIHVVDPDLYLLHEGKALVDAVNALTYPAENLIQLHQKQTTFTLM